MPIEQEFSRPSKESTDTSRASGALRTLRAREYARLDADGAVYVDFTGGGLYGASQVRRHGEMLSGTVFGNPHSLSPVSIRATEAVASTRRRILDFFRADPDEYVVIFTANASHALKIVGESYPFSPHSQLLLSFDNHNSVLGIREYARARHAAVGYIPLDDELRIAEATLDAALATRQGGANNLFAYPAQSNFSGVQHPLEWIARAHDAGWDVLLDAAAFVPTNRLDLSLRTGCFCNPGASEIALRLSKREIDECFPAAVTGGIDSFRDCMGTQKGTGAVRISFGIASCDADVDRVLEFARAVVAGGR